VNRDVARSASAGVVDVAVRFGGPTPDEVLGDFAEALRGHPAGQAP
jgi:hypothetical protein